MARTINCTNPSCGTLITVPEGAMQVICPSCNTWHFPSSIEEQSGSGANQSGSDEYSVPPPEDNYNIGYNDNPIPPVSTPYDSPASIEETPPSEGVPPAADHHEALGYLMTATGERLALKEGKNVIGRKNADLIINDKTVSRRHCVIEIAANNAQAWEFTLYDIGHLEGASSTNGVFVSGRSQRLQDYERIPVGSGTSIRIGNINLVLQCN